MATSKSGYDSALSAALILGEQTGFKRRVRGIKTQSGWLYFVTPIMGTNTPMVGGR